MLFRSGIVLSSDIGPVVESLSQAGVAGASHGDGGGATVLALFTGLSTNRRGSAQHAQALIISVTQEPTGFGKHRGAGDNPDPDQG